MKHFKLKRIFLLFLTLVFVVSCSTTPNENSKKKPKVAVSKPVKDKTKPKKLKPKKTTLNYKKINEKYHIKKGFINDLDAKLVAGSALKKDSILFIAKTDDQKKTYNGKFYDRDEPLIMSHLDLRESVDSYFKKYFNDFKIVGKIIIVKSNLNIDKIKAYAAYLDSNLIIMKKFREPSLNEIVYEMLLLKGNIRNVKVNYWYRSIAEAEKMTPKELIALNDYNKLAARDKNSKALYVNLDTVIVNLTSYNVKKVIKETVSNIKAITPILTKWQLKLDAQYQEQIKDSKFDTITYKPQPLFNEEMYNEIDAEIKKVLSEQQIFAIYALQKDLISYRMKKIVGPWIDISNGQILNIRAKKTNLIDTKYRKGKSKNKNTYITYTGYVVLQRPVTKLKNNPNLEWINNDLKFSFDQTKGGEGYYIDDSKMLNRANFTMHPARGFIKVKLPNGEYRYLAPYIPNLLPELQQYLYSGLALDARNKAVDQDHISSYKEQINGLDKPSSFLKYPAVVIAGIVTFLFFAV